MYTKSHLPRFPSIYNIPTYNIILLELLEIIDVCCSEQVIITTIFIVSTTHVVVGRYSRVIIVLKLQNTRTKKKNIYIYIRVYKVIFSEDF